MTQIITTVSHFKHMRIRYKYVHEQDEIEEVTLIKFKENYAGMFMTNLHEELHVTYSSKTNGKATIIKFIFGRYSYFSDKSDL